jgi:hypothetical protein
MPAHDNPPGWSYNPSSWRQRLPVGALALAGFLIAGYLALYQVGVVTSVWEPFFGNGSTVILRQSGIACLLPVSDAALGACAYLAEFLIDLVGGEDRWSSAPWAVLLLGLVAAGLGATGVVLVICQPILFHAFCTLCLGTAACSLLIVLTAADEVLTAVQHLRREAAAGRPLWQALREETAHVAP